MESFKHLVNSQVNNIKSYVLTKTPQEKLAADLKTACIPFSLDECRTCPDPCDVGHLEYPPRFDIDTASDMLGSVKPYMRQVVISTGKADWAREVTDEHGSLASFLSSTSSTLPNHSTNVSLASSALTYPSIKTTSRLGILNGSHTSHDDDLHRVLVLPDYKVVTGIPGSKQGAQALHNNALDPTIGRVGLTPDNTEPGEEHYRSYPLPYACVILLCSHKKRDNRCHIAAPKLETAFCRELEGLGWAVDHDLRDEDCMGPSLEELSGTEQEKEQELMARLQDSANGTQHDSKIALILKISHIGGHKYAGNVIIYTPQGSNTGTGIWYGRVSPHEVPAVVQHTILEGKILPELLRGGINLSRDEGKSLLDW